MATTAHRALYRSSILCVLLLSSCRQKTVLVPVEKSQRHNGIVTVHERPYTGTLFSLDSFGDTSSLTPFIDGKEEGEARQWYSRDKLKEIRYYTAGKKTGEHKGWWPNGQTKFVYLFTDDKFEGVIKEWYATGQLYREANYKNGYEEGMQKRYYEDGRLQANYEARNGRNYGNIGFKNCESPIQDTAFVSVL